MGCGCKQKKVETLVIKGNPQQIEIKLDNINNNGQGITGENSESQTGVQGQSTNQEEGV
jgi:hypothetical protein